MHLFCASESERGNEEKPQRETERKRECLRENRAYLMGLECVHVRKREKENEGKRERENVRNNNAEGEYHHRTHAHTH